MKALSIEIAKDQKDIYVMESFVRWICFDPRHMKRLTLWTMPIGSIDL